jgi:hypothetical protein
LPQLLRALLITLLSVPMLFGCAAPRADILLTDQGCSTTSLFIAKEQGPRFSVFNRSAVSMVVTVPVMNTWVTVAPESEASFELPRYIMGSFDFFCLTEAEHVAVSGGNPLLCVLEPADLLPVSLSSGVLEIEQHDRIQELIGADQ